MVYRRLARRNLICCFPVAPKQCSLLSGSVSTFDETNPTMKTILRNVLAVILGFFGGSVINMILVNLGPVVIPLPEGADVSDMEKLRESMKLFTPLNFLFPFLGHAGGTLVGAFIAAKIAASQQFKCALGVGVLFLLGGTAMVKMLGGPMWFNVCDLVLAYLPMAYLGGTLDLAKKPASEIEQPSATSE